LTGSAADSMSNQQPMAENGIRSGRSLTLSIPHRTGSTRITAFPRCKKLVQATVERKYFLRLRQENQVTSISERISGALRKSSASAWGCQRIGLKAALHPLDSLKNIKNRFRGRLKSYFTLPQNESLGCSSFCGFSGCGFSAFFRGSFAGAGPGSPRTLDLKNFRSSSFT
jgi:hypothetical protein